MVFADEGVGASHLRGTALEELESPIQGSLGFNRLQETESTPRYLRK